MPFASRSVDAVPGLPDEHDAAENQALTGWVLWEAHSASDPATTPPAIWLHLGDEPTPVRIEDFFADTGWVFDHTVAFWDPHCLWNHNALDQLKSSAGGAVCTTALHVAHPAEALAVVHHRCVVTPDSQTIAIVHIQDRAGASQFELDVPLRIVESSSMAAIVLGGDKDREVDRRLAAFCQLAAWRGPVVHALNVRGKTSGRGRGRNERATWPRSIRARYVVHDPGAMPSSLLSALQLMAPKVLWNAADGHSTASAGERVCARPESVASPSRTLDPPAMKSVSLDPTDSTAPAAAPSAPIPAPNTPSPLDPVWMRAKLSPGALAVLIVDPLAERPVLRAAGNGALAANHLARLQTWLRHAASPAPVDARLFACVAQVLDEGTLCVGYALQGQPNRFLVALGDPSLVTPRRLAWQLRVAANSL